jgi:hypothetical protein
MRSPLTVYFGAAIFHLGKVGFG